MASTDSVFMFVATMLVWIMTPGIALFYGGMVRSKNILITAMHSYMPMAVIWNCLAGNWLFSRIFSRKFPLRWLRLGQV